MPAQGVSLTSPAMSEKLAGVGLGQPHEVFNLQVASSVFSSAGRGLVFCRLISSHTRWRAGPEDWKSTRSRGLSEAMKWSSSSYGFKA